MISPSALVVERSREDLAVREVLVPVGRDPGAVSADGEGQVGALGDEAQLLLRAQELDHALQLVREGAPAGDRVAVVEQRGIEDEVLVLGERHLGVLRRAVRRIGGQHPAQLAVQGALEVALPPADPRTLHAGLALGVDRGQRLRVGRRSRSRSRRRPARCPRARPGSATRSARRCPRASSSPSTSGAQRIDRVRAGPQHRAVELLEQRLDVHRPLDHGQVARLHAAGVADEHVGEAAQAVRHAPGAAVSRKRPACQTSSPSA